MPNSWHWTKHWGSLLWFPLCSFLWEHLMGNCCTASIHKTCCIFLQVWYFLSPFISLSAHITPGREMLRAALPAWPCQGGKWFPHRAMFSNKPEPLTRNKFFPETDFYRALNKNFYILKWVEITIHFHQSSHLGLFQVRPSGLKQELIAVVHWCCCCDLNMKTNALYPNVSHFWRCLANFDLFEVKYSF